VPICGLFARRRLDQMASGGEVQEVAYASGRVYELEKGKHLLVDCRNVSRDVCLNDGAMLAAMARGAKRAGANVISQVRYQFGHNSPPALRQSWFSTRATVPATLMPIWGWSHWTSSPVVEPTRKTSWPTSARKSNWVTFPSGRCLVFSWNRKRRAHWKKNQWPLRHNPDCSRVGGCHGYAFAPRRA